MTISRIATALSLIGAAFIQRFRRQSWIRSCTAATVTL